MRVRPGGVVEWWFAVGVLVFLSGVARHLMHDSLAGMLTPHRLIVVAYLVLTVVMLVRARRQVAPIATRIWPVLLLPVLALLSTLWSASPLNTLRGAISLAGTTAFAVVFAVRFDLPAQLRLLAVALTLTTAVSGMVALTFPEIGIMTRQHAGAWCGLFTNRNSLGVAASLGLLACVLLSNDSDRRAPVGVALVLCAGVLACTRSRTALVATTACAAATGVLSVLAARPRPRRGRTMAAAAAIVLGVGAVLVWYADPALALIGRDLTFTGRTRIWPVALEFLAARPLLGHGYGAFWRTDRAAAAAELVGWRPAHAHNGLLDLGIELGAVGMVLFLVPFTVYLVRAYRHTLATRPGETCRLGAAPTAWWPAVYLFFYALTNVVESPLVRHHALVWVLYVASAATIARAGTDAATAKGS